MTSFGESLLYKALKHPEKVPPYLVRYLKALPHHLPLLPVVFLRGEARYLGMQKVRYRQRASNSDYASKARVDRVVGSYDLHNQWEDYDRYLMKYVDETFKTKVALDFACGPGRNIVKYYQRFARIDGADISPENIANAEANLRYHHVPLPHFFVTSGVDCGPVEDNSYDFIFSTIALQHICVYSIRYKILTAMYAALKRGGRISIQMGFGKQVPEKNSVAYHDNAYNAMDTNGATDTRVEDPNDVERDLLAIGFRDFEYWIRPVGPDFHPNWVFFTAVKGG